MLNTQMPPGPISPHRQHHPKPRLLPLYLAAILTCGVGRAETPDSPSGIAWAVQGRWQDVTIGARIETGSPIRPGALLRPQDPQSPHSIAILLPDGQRILDECFSEVDCNRGFRVPTLTELPSAYQAQLLARIGHAVAHDAALQPESPAMQPGTLAPRLEEIAAKAQPQTGSSPAYRVIVTGALTALAEGNYIYDLRRLPDKSPAAVHVPWSKTSAPATLVVPSPGIYEVTFRDANGIPRINLMLAAISPNQPDLQPDLLHAKATLQSWDEENYGWPVHSLLRAYLEFLYASAQKP